jgi:hypothetical protein
MPWGCYRFLTEVFRPHDFNAVSFPSVVAGWRLILCPCRDPQIGGEPRRRGPTPFLPTPRRGQIGKAQLVASLENYERNDVSPGCTRFSWH